MQNFFKIKPLVLFFVFFISFFSCTQDGKAITQRIKISDDVEKSILDAYNLKDYPFLTLELESSEIGNVTIGFMTNKKEKLPIVTYGLQKGKTYLSINLHSVILKNALNSFYIESFSEVTLLNSRITLNNGVILSPLEKSYLRIYYEDNPTGFVVANFKNSIIDENFKISFFPGQKNTVLHNGAFSSETVFQEETTIQFLENPQLVKFMILQNDSATWPFEKEPKKIQPLTADPGTIVTWQKSMWRLEDYEIFKWEQFPWVLIFDFADYGIQDKYLKRLAFFVEKNGFSGKLWKDEDIAQFHGFNAHDYRSESLAAFFNLALETGFELNEEEKHFSEVLVENNILQKIQTENGLKYLPTNTAIISICQESPGYLRRSLLGHECYHGIYFTDENFRKYVEEVFYSTDKTELDFLLSYFFNTPNLSYNPQDDYLIKNEFMAYLLQQSVKACPKYFASTLANRKYVNEATPELCEAIKKSQAVSLQKSCAALEKYIFQNYGLKAGQVYLVSKKLN